MAGGEARPGARSRRFFERQDCAVRGFGSADRRIARTEKRTDLSARHRRGDREGRDRDDALPLTDFQYSGVDREWEMAPAVACAGKTENPALRRRSVRAANQEGEK